MCYSVPYFVFFNLYSVSPHVRIADNLINPKYSIIYIGLSEKIKLSQVNNEFLV